METSYDSSQAVSQQHFNMKENKNASGKKNISKLLPFQIVINKMFLTWIFF